MVEEISPESVAEAVDDDRVHVVDIRRPGAFARGHIPGSENLPFDRLPDAVDRLAGAERVITVCPHGEASVQAARLIAAYEGIDEDAPVESMAGGLEEWDGPLASDDEHRTSDPPF